MARTEMNDELLDMVTGGSIVVSPDKKTCGYNCNNQYQINDFNALVQYYAQNARNLTEPTMLNNMLEMGYISHL